MSLYARISRLHSTTIFMPRNCRLFSHQSKASDKPIGFIGLGHMGSKMVRNFAADGHSVMVFDASPQAIDDTVALGGSKVTPATSVENVASHCNVVFSMLPNDKIVEEVSKKLLAGSHQNLTHISCSTISPTLSRQMVQLYHSKKSDFVAGPVFARPDGLARREATFMVAGSSEGRAIASTYLQLAGKIADLGPDVGSANVVKLCGNFLIAASIEAIAESMALAEKNQVDRKVVMDLLSSTIFNCLIYKGYGQRVSERDHRPGGFSLELGYKDVSLVSQAARDAQVPMPFLSTLLDRYTSALAKGRGGMDWSGIGLGVAEEAGIDVKGDVARNEQNVKEKKTY